MNKFAQYFINAGTVLLATMLLFAPLAKASSSPAVLESMLKTEKKKAAERKASLEGLTKEERALHKDLEKAEKRILDIEKTLAGQQEKIGELLAADGQARKDYQELLAKQAKTEEALAELSFMLWELTCQEIATGSRGMAEWDRVDREYNWSKALFASLASYRSTLEQEEAELAKILGRRETISKQTQTELASMEKEKQGLLQARIDYNKKLGLVRKEKEAAQDELEKILKIVDSLNLQLEEQSGEIQKQKGRLPQPAQGAIKKKFAPGANPPFRGIGIATQENAPVVSVAKGVVVHNDIARGFGRVVLIQHGKEYYSLYAFLGESGLAVGEKVSSRQVIGKAGVYPAVGNHGIYFELRFNQKAINPEQWLAS